jgi:hypothetical protein
MSVEEQAQPSESESPELVTILKSDHDWMLSVLGELTGEGGLPDRIDEMALDAGRDHRQDLTDIANELRRHRQ